MRPIHVFFERLLSHSLFVLECIHRSWELCAVSSTIDTCHRGFDFDLHSRFFHPPCLSDMAFFNTALFSKSWRKVAALRRTPRTKGINVISHRNRCSKRLQQTEVHGAETQSDSPSPHPILSLSKSQSSSDNPSRTSAIDHERRVRGVSRPPW